MSDAVDGVSIVVMLLKDDTNVVAAMGNSGSAENIAAGVIELGTDLPALGVSHISGLKSVNVKVDATGIRTERVQVTVHADTYPLQKSVLRLVRAALVNRHGTVHGLSLDSIIPDIEGPDQQEVDAGIYAQTADWIVKYRV